MNTSAPFMTDLKQSSIVKKQRAELYSRIYQYAAEDFVTTADFLQYMRLTEAYHIALEAQITALMSVISTHIHIVPPHSEKSATPTMPPTSGAAITWSQLSKPVYINTTLTAPNVSGNFVIMAPGTEGDLIPELRRGLPTTVGLTVTVPPLLGAGIL